MAFPLLSLELADGLASFNHQAETINHQPSAINRAPWVSFNRRTHQVMANPQAEGEAFEDWATLVPCQRELTGVPNCPNFMGPRICQIIK